MDRYDRQLRLWGLQGQSLLSEAHICIIGQESPFLQEILKNLVLVGASRFTWFHDLNKKSDGPLFYKDIVNDLNDLNPSGVFIRQDSLDEVSKAQNWKEYSLIVVVNDLISLPDCNSLPTVIFSYTTGLYGYMYTNSSEPHFIIQSHPDYEIPSLKIDKPWPELSNFMSSFDFTKLDEYEFAQLPFLVILYKTLENIAENGKEVVTNDLIRKNLEKWYLGKINPKGFNDLNYDEARRFSYLALSNLDYMKDVRELIQYCQGLPLPVKCNDNYNYFVYCLVLSLKEYLIENNDESIDTDKIPDMESSTAIYKTLKQQYKDKANEDFSKFKSIVLSKDNNIPPSLIKEFTHNIKTLRVIKPSMNTINSFFSNEFLNSPILQTLLKIQADRDIPEDTLNKSFLINATYPTASFMGGLVSEEIIKFITHQYVPVNNVLIFDGLNNNTNTFKY